MANAIDADEPPNKRRKLRSSTQNRKSLNAQPSPIQSNYSDFKSETFSETVQVVVGDAQPITVHKSVLMKVDFFRLCLRSPLREAQNQTIELSEDDPAVFDLFLEYLYFGKSKLQKVYAQMLQEQDQQQQDSELFIRMHDLYLMADKMGFEELHNDIMDRLDAYWSCHQPRIYADAMIVKQWPPHCKLARLYPLILARALQRHGVTKLGRITETDEKVLHEWIEGGGCVVREVFCLMATPEGIKNPFAESKCKRHVHDKTKKCGS